MGTTEYDPNFEFNAPKYHDFTNPADDDGADAWFDNLDSSLQDETMASAARATGAARVENQSSEDKKMEDDDKKMEEDEEKKMDETGEPDAEPDSTAEDPAESAMNISVEPSSAMAAANEEDEQPAEDGGDLLAAYTGAAPHMEEDALSSEEPEPEPEPEQAKTEEESAPAPAPAMEDDKTAEVEQQSVEDEHVAEEAATEEHEHEEEKHEVNHEDQTEEHEHEQESSAVTDCSTAEAAPADPPCDVTDPASSSFSATDAPSAAPEEEAAAATQTAPAPAPAATEAAAESVAVAVAPEKSAEEQRHEEHAKQSSRVFNKLTESILSLAAFKDKQQDLHSLAQSSVASLVSREASREASREPSVEACGAGGGGGGGGVGDLDTTVGADDFAVRCSVKEGQGGAEQAEPAAAEEEEEEPIAARTRRSLEKEAQEAQGGGDVLVGMEEEEEGQAAQEGPGSGSKRGHKPSAKKSKPAATAASAARFERFAGASSSRAGAGAGAGGSGGGLRTPSRGSSLTRPTSASAARATPRREQQQQQQQASRVQNGGGRALTVPVSPQLSSASRGVRRQRSHSDLQAAAAGAEGRGVRRELSSASNRSLPSVSHTPRRPTVPVSPRLSAAARGSSRRAAVSTEEERLRTAEEAMQQLRKRRKVGEAKLKHILDPRAASAAGGRVEKKLTEPRSPVLRSAARVRSNSVSALEEERSAESLGARSEEGHARSLTQRMAAFHSRPSTAAAGARAGGGGGGGALSERTPRRAAGGGEKRKLTEAKTPEFASFRRAGRGVQSRAEREEAELARMKASQFKARPLDRRILDSAGDLGVPKLAKKALTTPQAPVSHTSSRASIRSSQSSIDSLGALSNCSSQRSLDDGLSLSRATPRRNHALAAPPSARRDPKKLTIPVSPRLASSSRVRASSSASALASSASSAGSLSASAPNAFRAQPAPDMSRKFAPRHAEHRVTEPAPFKLSTDERHARLEKEAEGKREAAAQESKSSSSASHAELRVTDPRPFKLASDTRHEIHMAQFEQTKKRLEEEKRSFSSFHARPVPKTVTDSDKAFTPRRSAKPLTEVQEFNLNVDRRGRERQHFDQSLKEREAKAAESRKDSDRRQQLEQDRERRELRKQATVKARPVPSSVYHGTREVQRSSKALTEPHSPHFRMDARLRGQQQH